MVTSPKVTNEIAAAIEQSGSLGEATIATPTTTLSLEEFLHAPLDQVEWVDGQIVETTGMSFRHGVIQVRLGASWRNYMLASAQGGEVSTEAPCRTLQRVRRPDVAYATPAFLSQLAAVAVAPQSFPLIAEIVSPTDVAEDVFTKAQEYLQSGCEEAWLVFPENRYLFVLTQQQRSWFAMGDHATTQVVLPGFRIAIEELLA